MSEQPDSPRGRVPWGGIIVVGLIILALVVVPLIGKAMADDPEDWLKDTYQADGGDKDSSGLIFRSSDSVDQTVAAVDNGTNPTEKRQEGSTYYLRYKNDWLVTVESDPLEATGSEIKLFEFDAGYRSHGAVLFFWSNHYERGGGLFRGGGSGTGK